MRQAPAAETKKGRRSADGRFGVDPRRLAVITGVGAVLVVALLLLRLPIPAYVISPGPVFPLAGAVTINDGDPAPIDGDFLFLTVQLDDAIFLDVLRTAVNDDEELVTEASVLGDESEEEFVARQEMLFEQAQDQAIALGLALADSDAAVHDVTVAAEAPNGQEVGGPSAGLLTALAVADLASPEDVAAGRVIAGSGTVDEEGNVGVVGGIEDKISAAARAGATVFLVPPELVDAAQAADPAMDVIGVGSVSEAFRALTDR